MIDFYIFTKILLPRGMIIFGLIFGGIGLAYQIIFPLRAHSYVNSKMVMIFYFVTGKRLY